MTPEEFTDVCMPYYKKVFGDREMPFEKFAEILQKRTTKLTDIPEMLGFFAELPEYDKELFVNKKSKTNLENAPVVLREAYERLKALPTWDPQHFKFTIAIHTCDNSHWLFTCDLIIISCKLYDSVLKWTYIFYMKIFYFHITPAFSFFDFTSKFLVKVCFFSDTANPFHTFFIFISLS